MGSEMCIRDRALAMMVRSQTVFSIYIAPENVLTDKSSVQFAVSGMSTTGYQSGDCDAAVCRRQEGELLGLGNVCPDSLRHILKQVETIRTDD